MSERVLRKRKGFEGQQQIVLPKKIITNFLVNDPVTKQVYITDIGYYPKAHSHYVERSAGVNQHIIIYCIEGYGWIEIDKKRIEVAPSQFVTIPAGTAHRYAADKAKPWTIYWVHFKGDIATDIVNLILEHSNNYKPNIAYNDNRIKLFNDIYSQLESGFNSDTLRYANMIFYHFLSSLIYEEKFNSGDTKPDNDLVKLCIEMMQENINGFLTLDQLAKNVNLSKSHFCQIFRLKTGYAPIEYFNHLKIQKACQFLSFTTISINKIAADLGVQDPYYFSRMFAKLIGIPPSEYRKKNKSVAKKT